MAAIDLSVVAKHHRLIEGMRPPEPREEVDTVAVQARLIFLQAQHEVRSLHLHLSRDLHLAPHRIDGHRRTGQMQHAEQLGQGDDLVGFRVPFALCEPHRIGRGPGVHDVHRAFAISPVQGPPAGFPLQGHDALTQVGERLHPGDKGLGEARGIEHGKDAPKCIVGWEPMSKVQKLREPRRLGLPPVFDLHPVLRPANRREKRAGEDGLQGMPCGRMLETWVVDNGETSKHVVKGT